MNFYILTSKKKKLYFFCFIFLLFSFAIYSFFWFLDEQYTEKGGFTLHKFSKARHYDKLNEKNNFDIVLLGSSKAQNHLSSSVFKKRGLKLYNFGVPATGMEDLPYFINKIIRHKKSLNL